MKEYKLDLQRPTVCPELLPNMKVFPRYKVYEDSYEVILECIYFIPCVGKITIFYGADFNLDVLKNCGTPDTWGIKFGPFYMYCLGRGDLLEPSKMEVDIFDDCSTNKDRPFVVEVPDTLRRLCQDIFWKASIVAMSEVYQTDVDGWKQ